MKSYLWGVFWCLVTSFILSTGWYLLFGYNQSNSVFDNLINSYGSSSFWLGVAIWTVFYAMFVAFPIIFVRQKTGKESTSIS